MVAGKVKMVMGFQKSPGNSKNTNYNSSPSPSPTSNSSTNKHQTQKGSRSFGGYFPRSSAQVQPRPPDVPELLRLVEELRERESRLRTELLEHKLLKETVAIVPVLENQILDKDFEIEKFKKKVDCLEAENGQIRKEMEFLHLELKKQNVRQDRKVQDLEREIEDLKKANEELVLGRCRSKTITEANVCNKGSIKQMRKCLSQVNYSRDDHFGIIKSEIDVKNEQNGEKRSSNFSSGEIMESSENLLILRSRVPHVPKPPPRPSASLLSGLTSSSSYSSLVSTSSSPSYSSMADSAQRALAEISNIPPPPPPPPKICIPVAPPSPPRSRAAPPPPPPLPAKGLKGGPAKVRRVPEVVEFYHSLMRRDTRRDSGCGAVADGTGPATAAKDMIGEIENRSAYLLAIKTDVETQGDFIRFLIKEVENAVFADIEDVVPFVKWLDDELSFLVDERAVLKHFDWPEKKADALREAAFGYCDLKKLESQASLFRDDLRQPSAPALKKMQGLFEKLEHGVYNLSRMRESAANRYKSYNIPTGWMQDTGFVSQIKWASVKLAMKYMKRISSELETVGGCGPEEEELIVQGVRFAFRVHQFAGGFDVETMRAFQELRDKAKSCHVQWQNQLHQKSECKSAA